MSLLKGIVFVSCVLLLSVQCARNIDDFSADMSQMFVFVPTSGSVPQSTDDYTSGVSTSALIGGERDVELYVSEAGSNDIISVEVDSEVFSCSNSVNGRGYALLQYDGSDESLELVPNGLGSVDLTANGANAFTTAIESDTSGDVTFTVYSGSLDEKCSLKLTFPSANDDYVLAFVDFSGNCDFTKVGAIEVKVNMVSGLDLQMSGISTVKANVANPPPASPSTVSSSPDTSLSTASPPSNGNSTVSSGSSPSGLSSFSSSSGAASLVPEALLAAFVVLVSLF